MPLIITPISMREKLRDLYLKFMGSVKRPEPGIHIINSHYISPNKVNVKIDTAAYEGFLSFLSKTCRFVTVEEATSRINAGEIPADEVLVAFTFDDGFEECYTIIAPLLEKYNCRGAFFINANYISSGVDYQKQFNDRTLTYTKSPMTWQQVKDLHNRGHLIGAHTLDHLDLTKLTADELIYQLAENKKILEKQLNYDCEYFAWTYGQMQFFSEHILNTVLNYHKFIFSATNYKHYFSFNGKVINRRHIEAFWPKSHINYFLSAKKKIK